MGHLIAWVLVGLLAGALAGRVVAGGGFGILHAIHRSDAVGGFVGECIVAFLGACILLGLLRLVGRGHGGGRGATAALRH